MKKIPEFPRYEREVVVRLEDTDEPLENLMWHPQILTLDQLYALRFLVNKSIKMVKKIDVEEINNDRIQAIRMDAINCSKKQEVKEKPLTNIYLMLDKSIGAVKIGRSDKPKHRESTLQAEKPTIELVFSKPAPMRYEKIVQNHFSEFRLRGEWFNVSPNQVIDFINSNPPL